MQRHAKAPKFKLCKICASRIPSSAQKCIKCGSFQNFRRFIDFGSSTLALIIALISVIGLTHKNISDLYRSLFFDPLKPDVTTRIISASRNTLIILFQNNAVNRITIDSGALCRIPILTISYELSDGIYAKYPKPSEILSSHLAVYEIEGGPRAIEGGKSTTITYRLHQDRPEEGREIDERAKEIRAYCVVSYVDQRGNDDGNVAILNAIDAYYLQREFSGAESQKLK